MRRVRDHRRPDDDSSIPGLFAAGDLRAQLTRQVTTAAGDATTAAIAVEKYLAALRSGHPDPVGAILGDIGIPRPRAPEGEAARGGAERYGQTNDAPVLADR